MADVRGKIEKIKKFIVVMGTDEFKESFSLCKNQLIYLLMKVLPKKWKLWVHYGFDDPAFTGETTGLISCIYPFVVGHLAVQPDFDNAVFEEKFVAKGKIRGITLLIIAIRLFFSKDIRKTITMLKDRRI